VNPDTGRKRNHIVSVVETTNGNRKKTATALGIAENTLWRKLRFETSQGWVTLR